MDIHDTYRIMASIVSSEESFALAMDAMPAEERGRLYAVLREAAGMPYPFTASEQKQAVDLVRRLQPVLLRRVRGVAEEGRR